MMKKKVALASIVALSSLAFGGVVLGTISWFETTVYIPKVNINGNSAGAYFAYGNGNPETGEEDSKDRPYGISHPRHLYNLAWLQYTGFFADGQYYFELADSVPEEGLDMTGYILPPIGTEDNPFVGHFDGKGKIIKNLTVSNSEDVLFSNTNKHPNDITFAEPEIVGLFGVVGNLDGAYEGTYVTATNTIKDLGISDFTIETTTSKALVGIAAGYVDATISNVAVNDSSIDIQESGTTYVDNTWTSNLSDYGVVGYATEDCRKNITKLQEDLYDINITTGHEFNASDDGDSQGWGGSINMKTIYNRIVSLRRAKSTDVSAYGNSTLNYRIDRHYYDGTENTSERETFNTINRSNSTNDAYSRYNGFNETGHEYIGNYNVYARAASSGYGSDTTYGDQKFLYLSGGHYENRTYKSYTAHEGKYITDGTNYLTIIDGSLANTTNQSSAVLWNYDVGSSKISTKYQSATANYWLVNNNGTLTTTSNEANGTTWTVTTSSGHYDITNGDYHLYFGGNNWKLGKFVANKITDGTNYLRYNGSLSNATSSGTSQTSWTFETYNGTGRIYITYNNNTYYLRNNNGTLQTTNQQNQATSWTISSSGGQLSISNNNYYLTYSSGWRLTQFTPYYIIYDNAGNYMKTGSSDRAGYTTDFNSATKFGYNTTYYYYYDLSNTNKYLQYYSDSYAVEIYNDSRYPYRLVDNNGNLTGSLYGSGYLRAFNRGNNTAQGTHYVQFTGSSANNGWTQVTAIGSATPMNIDYYGTYPSILQNPNFTPNIDILDSTSRTGPDTYQTAQNIADTTNKSRMYYTAADTTYFPLNVEKDLDSYISNANNVNTQISSGNLDPKDSNTGYIISGSTIDPSTTTLTHSSSNIRISRYEIANVNASYNKSAGSSTTIADLADSSVYTINSAGTTRTMAQALSDTPNNFGRYSDSKNSFFQNSLSSSTNGTSYTTNTYVYGLHFMASTISKDSIVDASKVSVLGNKCGTYQFPVDCIDFNLKQKGVINFFAGTYFDDNDSFFSLHEIFRNDDATGYNSETKTYTSYNTISDIKEIEEIFSTDTATKTTKYSNIYKYKGASGTDMYSVPYRIDGNQNKYVMSKTTTDDQTTAYTYATMGQADFEAYVAKYGYVSKLKTSQIGKQASAITANRIYYFEFPMNPGEYCLGSVSGGTGAYLLYLDIGANAAKTQRTIIYERYKEIEKVWDYPIGVAIIDVTTVADNLENGTTLDETDTSNAVIYAGYNGILTISRNINDVTLTRSGSLTAAKPTLVGDLMWDESHQQYNIHDPGGSNLTNEITSRDTTTEVRILKYLDYNVNLDELMVTWIIDTSTDGGTTFTRTYLQQYANGTSSDDPTAIRVYNTNNGAKYTAEEIADQVNLKTDNGTVSTTVLVSFSFVVDGDTEATYEWNLEYEVDTSIATGHYYKFKDYVFEVTVTEGSITFKVLAVGSRTVKIGTTTVSYVGQEITISVPNP